MEIKEVASKVKEARESSKKRNFTQTFDCVINLQNMDLKKPEHKVDVGVVFSKPVKAGKLKICAVVDQGVEGAEKVFDRVVYIEELNAMKGDMKKIRTLTHKFDKFVVLSNHMPAFAQILSSALLIRAPAVPEQGDQFH